MTRTHCPYKHELVSSKKGYFLSKIVSVREDVECVFGILKKRWKILDYGICFRDINVVEKVFVVCCMVHNNTVSKMKMRESDVRVRHGEPIKDDGLWLWEEDRKFDVKDNQSLVIM